MDNGLIEAWRQQYNREQPHGALGNLAPLEYAMELATANGCSPFLLFRELRRYLGGAVYKFLSSSYRPHDLPHIALQFELPCD